MNDERVKTGARFRGRKEMRAHLAGAKLHMRAACLAKCYDCMSGYPDGAQDCRIPACPLYPRMPYRAGKAVPCP